jgi:formylglycine-generating enzyme required for sulfatase activity
MSITKSKRMLLNIMEKPAALMALFFVSAFAVNSSALEVDAKIPVVVNVGASVKIEPPAVGRGTEAEGTVTAGAQKMFDIKLVSRPEPEEVFAASVSHRQQTKTNAGAWISRSRSNVTVNLQPQAYNNAALSLYSINGRRILSGKVSASNTAKNSVSRSNISAGIYLLSVKGTNGNTFSARLTHGGGRLNINTVFSSSASPLLSKSMADEEPDYGEWTITVTAPGYIADSRKFSPEVGDNPQQSFTLTAVNQTARASFTETVNGVSFDMVYIPGGAFKLGCETGSGCPANTTPAVDAAVSPYFIGKTTVTRDLWQAVMGSAPGGYGLMFTWYDAFKFACKLSQLTGRNYRMQTEAEFEYAAKNHLSSLGELGSSEEWAYNTWATSLMGGTDPVGPGSGSHNQKTRRNAQGTGDNITGRLIRSIEGIGPQLRLTLSADTDLPPDYVHPCQLYAPEMGGEPVNSYRDPRWVTGGGAKWTAPDGAMGNLTLVVWEDGTATMSSYGGTSTTGQWFTSNNITFVFVPNPCQGNFCGYVPPITRYMYIFLNESDASYISDQGGAGRIVKAAANPVNKPDVPNLMRGEDLARSQPDFETWYKMVDMNNIPQSARFQDERLLDGPDHGWLQINTGFTHRYRKDVDKDEFRFIVSGAVLATGSWFTVNNSFLRVTNKGVEQNCTYSCPGGGWGCGVTDMIQTCVDDPSRPFEYVADYLYVVTPEGGQYGGRFMHNSFMGYERGDFRSFEKIENNSSRITDIANQCSRCVGEIPKGQNVATMYRNDEETGQSTFVPAPCPEGGCR